MDTPNHEQTLSANGAPHPDPKPRTLVHTDSPDDLPYEGETVQQTSDDTPTIPRRDQTSWNLAADSPDDLE